MRRIVAQRSSRGWENQRSSTSISRKGRQTSCFVDLWISYEALNVPNIRNGWQSKLSTPIDTQQSVEGICRLARPRTEWPSHNGISRRSSSFRERKKKTLRLLRCNCLLSTSVRPSPASLHSFLLPFISLPSTTPHCVKHLLSANMDAQTEAPSTSPSEAVPAHHFPSLIERYYTQRFAVGTPSFSCNPSIDGLQNPVFLTLSDSTHLDASGQNEDIYVYCHTNGYAN